MKYVGGGGYCQWDFISTSDQQEYNDCAMTADLEALASNLTNDYPGHYFTIYAGPNDCMMLYGGQSVASAAQTLHAIIDTVWTNSSGYILEYAIDDNELYGGYDPSTGQYDCGGTSTSNYSSDYAFFQDYYASGGSTYIIGPGGAYPTSASEENSLAGAGGGPGTPQIAYASNLGGWPYPISTYYLGLQVFTGYISDCTANSDFYAFSGYQAYPPYDFNVPGVGSC